jgi:hypothetical protein
MGRLRYALPEDAVRRMVGATVPRASSSTIATALDNNNVLGTEDDRETFTTAIEAIESKWDREATPMRAVPVGSSTVPKFYSAKGKPWPVRLYLDHRHIQPIDAAQGDFVEVRTGRDQYKDYTSQEGSAWTADYEKGIIEVYRAPGRGQLPAFHRVREKFLKINYRKAAGGDFSRAGETTLDSTLASGTTGTVDVADASQLPEAGEPFLLGGSEYAYISSVDHDNDTITIDERGIRFTTAVQHAAGDAVHFCPIDVRDAVAAMSAARIFETEDLHEAAFDGDLDAEGKMETWVGEYNDAVGLYSDQGGYS